MRKKLLTFLLALAASVGLSWAQNPSGSCGTNLSWEFNPSTGTLTITGSGAMTDWASANSRPWHSYQSDITSLSLPEGLTFIGRSAFQECQMTSVELPNSLVEIGRAAFCACGLTSVTIPDNVQTIGQSAFASCQNLSTITIGSGVTSIGYFAFSNLMIEPWPSRKLESVTCYATTPPTCGYDESFTELWDKEQVPLYVPAESVDAYKAAEDWKDFDVQAISGGSTPTGLQVIELQVPDSWENDQQLVIVPDLPGFVVFSLEEAGTWAAPEGYAHLIYASKNNEGVRVTYFNNGVWGQEYVAGITRATVFGWASSGHRIFYTTDGSASALPSWVLDGDEWDESTKTLTVNSNPGAGAYASQSEIENLIISDAVTSIGQAAFGGCSNISYVSCGNNIQTIGVGAFTMCGFTYIELPASVTTIGNSAFYSCSNLSSVTIGNNVASIGNHAFDACGSLTEITIPASVTTIGVDAFYNCTSMTDVYCYPNAADLTWNEDGCDDFQSGNATQCHVNADQLDAYQTKFNGVVRVTFVGDLPAPAAAGLQVTELQIPASWQGDNTLVTISDLPGFVAVSSEEAEIWDAAPEGDVVLIYTGINNEGVTAIEFNNRVLNDFGPFGGFSRADLFAWGYKNFYTSGGSTPTPQPEPEGDGKLTGAFTINANGDQIVFSNGNLQYQASTSTLRFATNQYDLIGADNANISDTYTGWIDLFGWGTGNNPAKKSTDDEDYSTFTDWGVNAISNGGNEANLWRTLTRYEWAYLIQTRTNAADLKGQATVADVHGFVLLPDSWTLPAGLSFTASPNDWTTNVYTAEQWAQMEAAGAVFLPAAGYRNPDIIYVGEKGWYWSSDVLTANAAYDFEFTETNSRVFGSRHYFGQPVRLVTAAPAVAPTPVYTDADFAIDFMSDPYTVVGGGALPTGVEVAGDFHDTQHGYSSPVITIPVTAGNYLVKMGACQYSNQDGSVKNEDGSVTYTTLATNTGVCYDANPSKNYVADIITIPSDQIIKVYGAQYTPYFSIQKMPEIPAFTDFEINFRTDPYSMISGAKPEGTVIIGTYHDNLHGYQNVEAVVPVEAGNYRLTVGACQYGTPGNVMSETNAELASFNSNTGVCYHNNTAANIVSTIFTVDIDQTITINGGAYMPYMKLEKLLDNTYYINFENAEGAIGTVPGEVAIAAGESWTIPANLTLYKEGYTFAGWSDGVNTYAPGDEFFPSAHGTLEAVYTANTVSIADASTINVKWYFGESNGAPSVTWNGAAGYLLAKGEVDGKLIDLKLDIDATSGKFDNAGRGDKWAQVNANTVFTFPSKEGAVVNVESYSGSETYNLGNGTLTCNTNDYYSYLEIVYPAPTTAVVIGDPNNASEVETFLTTYDGQTIDELIIDRPVYNNMYNTLCLPFDMNAAQIAASSLNGVEIREFTGASVDGTTLNLSVSDPVNAVVAGRPYFVKYSAASQLDDLHFEGVTINNALLDNMAVTFDGVTFKGTFTPFVMPNGLNFQGGYLFLGQNNQLFWPNTDNPLKPFRAYFYVDVESSTPGNAPKYRGMPARIVEGKNVATGVENAQSANQSTKVIVNGQLIIIKNDVRYNAQGQMVK